MKKDSITYTLSERLNGYLHLGYLACEQEMNEDAIDYFVKGLQLARELKDKPRIQQFSNLILSQLNKLETEPIL